MKFFYNFILLTIFINSQAQSELKFNLATSLVLVPNIGIEIKINEKIGYQLDTSASFWDSVDGSPYQFVQIFNELRFYLDKSNRSFFIGPHIGYGMFTLKNPKFLTDIVDTAYKEEGSYQSGRNTYYGLTIGKKVALKNPKFKIEEYIYEDALKQLLESERIKSVIRDFEQDLWNN